MSITLNNERQLAQTLLDPVLWGQAYLLNRNGDPRTYWEHQIEDLRCLDDNIIHLDGRGAGKCLSGDTLITDCGTGEQIRLDKLGLGHHIAVLGPDQKLHITNNYEIHQNGPKPCWKLTTRSGRYILATSNHPFLTNTGWQQLRFLRRNDWIAVPSRVPLYLPKNNRIKDEELILLALLIADGGLSTNAVKFTKTDPILIAELQRSSHVLFPQTIVKFIKPCTYRIVKGPGLRNPCITWLRQFGLMDKRSESKFIPSIIFQSSLKQIALFLSYLFTCDGWFYAENDHKPNSPKLEIGYCSASYELAEGVRNLLLRFGIRSAIRVKPVKGKDYWNIDIRDRENVKRFARLIGMVGSKGIELEWFADEYKSQREQARTDCIPANLVEPHVHALREAGITTAQITGGEHRRITLYKYNPSRQKVREYAENTGNEAFNQLSSSDIFWDQVQSIEPAGIYETYDLSVPGYLNFVANDIFVHNSVNISTDALHFSFITRGGQGLIAAPHQGHLDTLIEEMEFQLEHNPDLMSSVALTKYGKPKILKKPYFKIEFTNGSILYFRPAGAYGDAFRSLHVDRVWVDEGAWLSERAWKALRQCLKTGGRLRIYSTPNGLRDTTYYRLTLSDQFKVFRWPSWLNPNWTKKYEDELVEFYGGKDTSGWQHEVAGEHGKPSYGTFNIEQFNLCCQEILEYRKIIITDSELRGCDTEESSYDRLEMLLNLIPQTGVFWIGGDLGYTNDPTELVVFQEIEIAERVLLRLVLRIHLEHVTYPHISQIISLIDRYYTPTGIGVDNGGNGISVIQELLTLDKYKGNEFEGRLKGYDFGGMTKLSLRDGREIKKRTKELMTSLINGAIQRKQILFPSEDVDIEDQFTTHTYILRDGNVIYSKGNDHIIDAVRCAMLVREEKNTGEIDNTMVSIKPVLTDPIFI